MLNFLILCFSLEKLNDLTTSQYFRGTNRKDDPLKQLLEKRTRLEYYRINSEPIIESKKSLEKKNKSKEFYLNTVIFNQKFKRFK